jgi:hypothetical protein
MNRVESLLIEADYKFNKDMDYILKEFKEDIIGIRFEFTEACRFEYPLMDYFKINLNFRDKKMESKAEEECWRTACSLYPKAFIVFSNDVPFSESGELLYESVISVIRSRVKVAVERANDVCERLMKDNEVDNNG